MPFSLDADAKCSTEVFINKYEEYYVLYAQNYFLSITQIHPRPIWPRIPWPVNNSVLSPITIPIIAKRPFQVSAKLTKPKRGWIFSGMESLFYGNFNKIKNPAVKTVSMKELREIKLATCL